MTPIILLSIFGIINMFLGSEKLRNVILPLVLVMLAVVLGVNLLDWDQHIVMNPIYNNMLRIDNFSVAFTGIVVLSALLIAPFSDRYLKSGDRHTSEYYALLLFSLVGAIMMVSYENMLMLFIGIEILSIAMYVLAGSNKDDKRSNEAAIKYFLMGAFATGILLFGIALIYGATGSFYLSGIQTAASITDPDNLNSGLLGMGILLLLIGLCFKLGAAPFHFWTPDVYEGTPTLFTAFMSTVVKTAGIAAFVKLLFAGFHMQYGFWYPTLMAITALTLLIGNVTAAVQDSVKRMLAYSSISHAGYLLMALTVFNDKSTNAILFYSLAYSVATIGAFGVLLLVADARGSEKYDAFSGLGLTNPLLAFVMTVSMLSLAGIPLTAGFFGKFFVFAAAAQNGQIPLMIFAILMAAVGIYYYFRVIISMYMNEPVAGPVPAGKLSRFVLLLTALITILLGIVPGIVPGIAGYLLK
jgi:NADH-quinone oxidoreductase subunit N